MRVFEIQRWDGGMSDFESQATCAEWDHVRQWFEARGIVVELETIENGEFVVFDRWPSTMVSEPWLDVLVITNEKEFRKELLVRKGIRLARRQGGDAGEWRQLFKEHQEELRTYEFADRFHVNAVQIWEPSQSVESYVESEDEDELGVPYDEQEIDQRASWLSDFCKSTDPKIVERAKETIAEHAQLAAEGSLYDALLLSRFRERSCLQEI